MIRGRLVALSRVYHVGSLDPADKGCQGESYEGDGLSISVHPDAWIAIARLGGLPTWAADIGPMRVVDGHGLVATDGLMKWAAAEGWVVSIPGACRLAYYDAELECMTSSLFRSRSEAEREAEALVDVDSVELDEVVAWGSTLKLAERMLRKGGCGDQPEVGIEQDVATAWAQEHGYEGIWWNDQLDQTRLSAPRGVLFPVALRSVEWVDEAGNRRVADPLVADQHRPEIRARWKRLERQSF